MLGEQRLLTGPEAGITRDSISVDWMYEGRKVKLVDTAGLRRKSKVQEKLERMSTGETVRSLKYADIIAVKGDVLRYINLLQRVDMVFKHGQRVK